jgi:hypothetical protein
MSLSIIQNPRNDSDLLGKFSNKNFFYFASLMSRVTRKIVGAPHQFATASHRYLFAASVNRGSFYNTSALHWHWIVMVEGILDALTIFRPSLLMTIKTPKTVF